MRMYAQVRNLRGSVLMRKIITVWVCAIMIASAFVMMADVGNHVEGKEAAGNGVMYVLHAPIRINSNGDFAANANGGGDGSAGNPWIIENYDIDGTGYAYCVYVGNTTDYFVVRNCFLHDSNGVATWPFYDDTGITMYNASNGLLSGNEITRIRRGIYLYNGCMDNQVIWNNVSQASWSGIHLSTYSDRNSVINNHVSDVVGWLAVAIAVCDNSVLRNNTIVNANQVGMLLSAANNTIIENNSVSNSGQYGIQVSTSTNVSINSCEFTNDLNGIVFDSQTSDVHLTGTNITSMNTGVSISGSQNNILEYLHIYGGTTGLHMETANENVISNVESRGGSQGLFMMSSDSNAFTGSTFSNSQYGAIVQSSDNNTFADCFMENNTGQGGGVNSILNTYETDLEVYQNDDNWAAYSSFEEQLAIGDGGNPLFTRAVDVYGTSLFAVRIYGNMTDVVDLDMGIFLDGKGGNPIDGQTQTGEFVQYSANIGSDESVTIVNPQDGTYLIRVFGYAVLGNPGHFNMSVSLYQIGSTGIALIESNYNTISSCRINSNVIGALVISGNVNTIANNTVSNNNNIGIFLDSSNSNTISNNTASSNYYSGIYLQYSSNNTIANNTASSHCGIYLVSSCGNTVANNTASSYTWSGITLENSSNNIIANNTASGSYGLYLDSSSNNIIANNTASGSYGLYLDSSSNNTIANNTALGSIGIYLWQSSSNTLASNTASNGQYGIHLDSSSCNTLTNNTMVNVGIFISGTSLESWNTHTIDISNTVNGKPVRYWKNQTGGTVLLGAGQVILAN
jgi:parallel beta-helix repeat protein